MKPENASKPVRQVVVMLFLFFGGAMHGESLIKFTAKDRLHAQWDLYNSNGLSLYWVEGGTKTLIASGPHVAGQERRIGLNPGTEYGYLIDYVNPDLKDVFYGVTPPLDLSGTMLYDEMFTGLENLSGSVVIPAGCTLQIENSLNLSFGAIVYGTLRIANCTNVNLLVNISGGTLEINNSYGVTITNSGSGGNGTFTYNRFNGPVELGWTGGTAVFLGNIFDANVEILGTGYRFVQNTFYGEVGVGSGWVGSVDPEFEENVFLGCLVLKNPDVNPSVEHNSFLGRWGITYDEWRVPAPQKPIRIGANYYGDPNGPIVPGQQEWIDRTSYNGPGGRFLSRDGALVLTVGRNGTYLVLDPPLSEGQFRKDKRRFPDIWCNGVACGHNSAPHKRLGDLVEEVARTGLPYLISVDIRGWDQHIRGVRVYAEIDGDIYEADNPPEVARDLYNLPAGKARIKHGGTTFNIIIPSLEPGSRRVSLYLDTRGVTDYEEPLGTNKLLASWYMKIQPAFARPLHIMVVPWAVFSPGYPTYTPTSHQLVSFLHQKLPAMLPLRRDEYKITVHPACKYESSRIAGILERVSSMVLFHRLRYEFTQFLDTYNASTRDPVDRLFVVVPHGVLGSANGMAGSGVNHMFDRRICVLEDSGIDAAIHELGHSFGLWTGVIGEQYSFWNYPPDGIVVSDITGFSPDPALKVDAARIRHFPALLGGTQWYDVMGRAEPSWPVYDTWLRMYLGLSSLLGTKGVRSIQSTESKQIVEGPLTGYRRILIRALVDHRYRIIPGTVRAADVTGANFASIRPPSYQAGDRWYEFAAFDSSGNVLTNYQIVLEGLDVISTNAELGGTPWQATFDYPASAVRCELRGGQYDWSLYWEAHMTNPITCTFISPSTGAILSNMFQVAWHGAAPTPLLYRFMWSVDGGTTWLGAGDFTESTNINMHAEFLPHSTNICFKVVATDGIKSVEARVDNLHRVASPPRLTILSPRDGDRNDLSNRWTFKAEASDPFAGILTNVVWYSSRDGLLGAGLVLEDLALSPGNHQITAIVSGIGGTVTQCIQVAAVTLTNVDLKVETDALRVQPLMLDPAAPMPNFMAPNETNHVVVRVRNEGVTNVTTLSLALFMRPSDGGETLIATNTFFLAAFEQGELHADVIPTANGFYEFRAVVSVVDPPDSNLANNQCTWIVPCGSGSLFVAIHPPEVAASAFWSVDGGPWLPSGTTVTNLVAGVHTISFQVPPGYITPSNRQVEILPGRLTVYERLIEKDQGYLKVTITPEEAIAEGALWRLDDTPEWYASGTTLSNVPIGTHVVWFREIPWWSSPPSQTVTVAKASLTVATGSYAPLPRPPRQAILGGPPDGATNQPLNTAVYWFWGDSSVTGARVYFGTNPVLQTSDLRACVPYYVYSYDPGPLEYNTTYYWRVDPTNDIGVTTGQVWCFTTKPPGPEFTSPLVVSTEDGVLFNYRLTAIRATQVGVGELPSWLTWVPPDTLRGIPSGPGMFVIPVWATNESQREEADLVILVEGGTRTLQWQRVASNTSVDLLDVAYGGGMFVAVGAAGTLLLSTNGITWQSQPIGRVETLHSVAWGNGRFVAVGGSGLIITSTNGVHWTTVATGTTEFTGVCWGSNQFVAVGYYRNIRTSSDGINWVYRGPGGSESLSDVVWGTNGFIAVGGMFSDPPSILHSLDGVTWNSRDTGTYSDGFYGVSWGNGVYVAVGYNGKIMISTNGITWTQCYAPSGTILRGVSFYDNQFIIVGHSGLIMTSHRGGEWTLIDSGTSNNLHAVAGGARKIVVVGQQGTILVADYEPDRDLDGMPDWQEQVAGTNPLDPESILKFTALRSVTKGIALTWNSVTGRTYMIYRATNLTPPAVFVPIITNIMGQSGVTTVNDTNIIPGRNYFYRLGVRE